MNREYIAYLTKQYEQQGVLYDVEKAEQSKMAGVVQEYLNVPCKSLCKVVQS